MFGWSSGAYNILLTARVPTHSMTMANATYAFPAIRATLTEVFTNKTPTDAYRGAGRPEAAYFVERAMDMLARELEMDPAELRRKNFIQPDQFPYRTQMGAVYDSPRRAARPSRLGRCQQRAGRSVLVIRQPDGTLAQVPTWMCEPAAACSATSNEVPA